MPDQYVINFCKDCLEVLRKQDEELRNNLANSQYALFYKYDNKGINVYSITEPILKFFIFSSLCSKYQIWPEGNAFYKDKQLLDLALFSQRIENIDEEIEPDIAIEMKWADFTRAGRFYKWSIDNSVDDLYKLKKDCTVKNKYLMQFGRCNTEVEWKPDELLEQLLNRFDKRKIRGKQIRYIFGDSFNTCNSEINADQRKFNILLWKIE